MAEVNISYRDFFELKKSPRKGTCHVKWCVKKSDPRWPVLCPKHSKQLWRARNPTKAAFNTLRDHARERKVPFHLTFDDFVAVVRGSSYVSDKGRSSGNLHIDRVDPTRGYEPGNIAVLTASENIAKGNKERQKLVYRIALFERLGYKEDAERLRDELTMMDYEGWIDYSQFGPSYWSSSSSEDPF